MVELIDFPHGLLGVEVRHFAALEAIVETGSFAEAGRRLGYSQSTISHQLAHLERAAGVRLLDRRAGTRRIALTDAGERILRHAHRVADAIRAAEADLRSLAAGEAGTLDVGTFQSASVRLLPLVMRDYATRRSGITVRLYEADYEEDLRTRLRTGELELSFLLRTEDPALAAIHVLTDPYVLLVPRGDPLARGGSPVTLRTVAELPLVAYKRSDQGGEAALIEAGAEPKVVFRSDETGVVQGLVGAGLGYAVVPRLTVARDDRTTVVIPVAGIAPREITLSWHADRTLSPGAAAFVEVVEEVAGDLRLAVEDAPAG
ncbi:MAG: LysR family transcriptional regulator [Gaiellales bacterium]